MPKSAVMWFGLLLGIAALATGLASFDTPAEQWSAATRYTARIGFPLFIIAYVARPLVELTRSDWAKWLLARRKYFGLGFALSHTVHLVAIVMLFRTLGEIPSPAQFIFGGFAYVMLYAMALTSYQPAMKALGKRWKTLHRLGIHYLWIIFAQSYIKRLVGPENMAEALVGTLVILAAAGIRFAAWNGKRSTKTAAAG